VLWPRHPILLPGGTFSQGHTKTSQMAGERAVFLWHATAFRRPPRATELHAHCVLNLASCQGHNASGAALDGFPLGQTPKALFSAGRGQQTSRGNDNSQIHPRAPLFTDTAQRQHGAGSLTWHLGRTCTSGRYASAFIDTETTRRRSAPTQ
jgi:hypothetical protein